MTNAAVLNKTSNLVMPMHYVELDKEEMSYVEGGLYIGQEVVDSIVFAISATTLQYGIPVVAAAIKGVGSLLFSTLHAIPVIGSFLAFLGKVWLLAQAWDIAEALCVAFVYRKGMDVSFGWHWFIPIINFEARR